MEIICKELRDVLEAQKTRDITVKTDVKSILSNAVLSPCTATHNKVCSCQREVYDAFRLEYATRERILLKDQGLDDPLTVDMRLDTALDNGTKAAAQYCIENEISCPHERAEIDQMITFFLNRYDSSKDDPIFIEAIKIILNLHLIVFRLRRDIGYDGTTITRYDRNDNPYEEISPLLKAQKEYEEAKLRTLQFLDSKLNKQDTNINISGGLSIKEVMETIIDVTDTDAK